MDVLVIYLGAEGCNFFHWDKMDWRLPLSSDIWAQSLGSSCWMGFIPFLFFFSSSSTVTVVVIFSLSPCQDDECYEQSADVRSQLRFFEQLERIEKQRKDEQEREILLKAAKVSYCHLAIVLCVCVCVWQTVCYVPHATVCFFVYRSVYMSACCSCAGPDRWIRVWHQWMKWPPRVLPGSWPRGSSVLAPPPRTRRGGVGGETSYTTQPPCTMQPTHTHTRTQSPIPVYKLQNIPLSQALTAQVKQRIVFQTGRPISQCDRKKKWFFDQSIPPKQ